MYTVLAHHGTAYARPLSSILSGSHQLSSEETQLGKVSEGTMGTSSTFRGHLGVLRQDDPTLERQRRYDFWFKQA